jgi:sterol desaturase/sphingolipid hydroxylase (fatty acid hydroxylase superfamily)
MDDYLLSHESVLRLAAFFGIFAVMAIWEILAPRRVLTQGKLMRWGNNLALVALNTLLLRALFPTASLGMAELAAAHHWGLLPLTGWPALPAVIVSIVLLDAAIYLQHVMFHAVPLFWRLHRVHHADLDIDVTTGARFHPIEIILSMLIKFAAIILLGPPVIAVLLFEVLLNASSMFNHSNVQLPPWLDRVLRLLLVTPDMHRVHHSHLEHETNSNFGFNLSCWDRLFGTYRAQPEEGHTAMQIGIDTWRDPAHCTRLDGLLRLPFIGTITDYAINRRRWDRQS